MILGITGTDGAGKGSVVNYLVQEKGFTHYSARDLIVGEIKKRHLIIDRPTMRLVANDLRATHGNDFIVTKSLEKAATEGVSDVVVESIRATAEAKTLKEKAGILLVVDADQMVRYERIVARASESDWVSFDEFVAQEKLEFDDPDPNGMQKGEVIKMADYTILNNGTVEELHAQVDEVLEKISKT